MCRYFAEIAVRQHRPIEADLRFVFVSGLAMAHGVAEGDKAYLQTSQCMQLIRTRAMNPSLFREPFS